MARLGWVHLVECMTLELMRMHWPVKRMRLVLSTVTSSSPSSI